MAMIMKTLELAENEVSALLSPRRREQPRSLGSISPNNSSLSAKSNPHH